MLRLGKSWGAERSNLSTQANMSADAHPKRENATKTNLGRQTKKYTVSEILRELEIWKFTLEFHVQKRYIHLSKPEVEAAAAQQKMT